MSDEPSQRRSRFDLTDKVAVVTGGSGKLGPVWSRGLLESGAIVFSLDLPGAYGAGTDALADRYGSRLRRVTADVTDRVSLEVVLRAIMSDLGHVDVLVNNAGIDQPPSPEGAGPRLETLPVDSFRRVFEVNLFGAFQAAQVFGSAMAERGEGRIINIGSLYASHSPDNRYYDHLPVDPPFMKPPAYGASKAALVNLTRYLATIWAQRGVCVNSLSPGGVLGAQDETFKSKFTARVPLGRMAVDDDLVGPLVFLASDASRYVTGVDLLVDGGYSAW
jgi:NAD(P)-dependent dehydrogenase (short-subunit alcohol dehydrogenase family)